MRNIVSEHLVDRANAVFLHPRWPLGTYWCAAHAEMVVASILRGLDDTLMRLRLWCTVRCGPKFVTVEVVTVVKGLIVEVEVEAPADGGLHDVTRGGACGGGA